MTPGQCVYLWILAMYKAVRVPCIVSVTGVDLSTDTISFGSIMYTPHTSVPLN